MKIVFFDLETQYIYQELGMTDNAIKDPSKLRLAVAGILSKNHHTFFDEGNVGELFDTLKQANLIVGHNVLRFDYKVLQPYLHQNIVKELGEKTFDIMHELDKLTGCWISLDDLCKKNVGLKKTVGGIEIPRMWREKQFQKVKDYLLNDLRMTEAVYNHGKTIGRFMYTHKEYGKVMGEKVVSVRW